MERLCRAANERDIEAFVSLIHPDYASEQPAHPDRAFGGREQVRENWTAMFSSMPDFTAEIHAVSTTGDTAWTEWVWRGGSGGLEMRGVTLFTVRDGLIVGGRLYMEPVEQEGAGIRSVVADLTQRASGTAQQ
jgi:ketosteroid isomerase-like protein